MATTYTLIASTTVGSGGASSIDFTSIPSTYTDLQLLVTHRVDVNSSGDQMLIKINGSTSTLTAIVLYGNGSTATSGSIPGYVGSSTNTEKTTNTFSNTLAYFTNYAGSTYKSYSADSVQENNGTGAYAVVTSGLWSNTAAITSISLYTNNGKFVQYSTAYLYGILKA